MTTVLDVLADPWHLEFMRRAFVAAVFAGAVCGVVGTFVVLRGMAFIGDTVAHAAFPGVATAYVLGANLTLGGAVAGVATAVAIALISQSRRLKEDTVIGVLFAAAFGLGIVIVSTQANYTGDLTSFLFGHILGINDTDVWTTVITASAVIALVTAFRKELVAVALDREAAAATGLPVTRVDLLLYAAVAIAIVVSLQSVGNILVLALLVTPAATARLLTERLGMMIVLSALIGSGASVTGLYLSYNYDLAAGGLIVMVVTIGFVGAWLFAPHHGIAHRRRAPLGPD